MLIFHESCLERTLMTLNSDIIGHQMILILLKISRHPLILKG
jgi:hypothetical protein